jgi:DNA-binding NtrC family response regulator
MFRASLLVVEDNEDLCETLAEVMRKEGHRVRTAYSGEQALSILRKDIIDLVLLDIKLPEIDGLRVLEEIKEIDPDLLVIMITAITDAQPAVDAMKKGAYDYLMKPFELDELKIVVNKALETHRLKREVSRLRQQQQKQFPDDELFGNSPAMFEVKRLIKVIADTPRTSVLIEGESGTGKELVANAVHNWSARADKPLIKLNCAAIPENLLESELFGHEKGAFTDAKTLKKGMFELANGGSIFLDEIVSMKPALQPKLLRVLETQSFRRIGGVSDINIDVRIIAATNRNLEEAVRQGVFREDLYYRLKVMVITLPPLRERVEDILPLASLFIGANNEEFGKDVRNISEEAKLLLLKYPWPGNVRELKNVIERAVILCTGDTLLPEHLPMELRRDDGNGAVATPDFEGASGDGLSLQEMERRHIIKVLKQNKGNKSKTARILRISRSTLREKMKVYGITDI